MKTQRKIAIATRQTSSLILGIAFLAAVAATFCACAGKTPVAETEFESAIQTERPGPVLPESDPADRRYLIGPGDVLSIQVYRREDLSKETPVRDDGDVFVPLAGTIRAEGLTAGELAGEIRVRLAQYLRDPQVDVIVVEAKSRVFSVLGEVNQPGSYPLDPQVRVLEALGAAHGFTDDANLTGAYLVRGEAVMPIDFYELFRHGAVEYNVFLEDRDFIYIPSREELRVYVLGEVKQPQVVNMTEGPLTLPEAIATAGGFDEITAFKSNIKIIRGNLADPEVITVDLDRVLRGKGAEVPVLEAGDIVYVPASGLAKWDRLMGQLLPNLSRILVDAAAAQSLAR